MQAVTLAFRSSFVLATISLLAILSVECQNRALQSDISSTVRKLSADCDMNLTGLAVQDVFRAGKKIQTRYLFDMQKNRKDYWEMYVKEDLTYKGENDDCVKSIRVGSMSSKGTWVAYQYGEDGKIIADCSDVNLNITAEAKREFSSAVEHLRFFESNEGFQLKNLLLEKDKLEKIELPMRVNYKAETYLLPTSQSPYRQSEGCPDLATSQDKVRRLFTFDYLTSDGVHSHLVLRGKQTVVPEVGPLPRAVLIGSEVITDKKNGQPGGRNTQSWRSGSVGHGKRSLCVEIE